MKQCRRIKILFIPAFKFHSKVPHAGGKVLNYYFSQFYNSIDFEVGFGYCTKKFDKDYSIASKEYPNARDFSIIYSSLILYIYSIATKIARIAFPDSKLIISSLENRNAIERITRKAKLNWEPDIVVMDWTQANVWVSIVRKNLPNAKIIAVEHDVFFQSVARLFPKNDKLYKYTINNEINALKLADKVIVFCEKDKELLRPYLGTNKILIITPYYDRYIAFNEPFNQRNGIIFFGAMQRYENIEAVKYFLENIYPLLKCKDHIIFYCVGGGVPNDLIKKYSTKNIIFTGFVDSPTEYFKKAFCLVVPLLHGAGIKIKVLEGMASGIPVITNNIGIEGIPANPGEHYIHCNSSEEYIKMIDRLYEHREECQYFANNAISFVNEKFSLDDSFAKYKQIVLRLKNE